MRQIIWDHPMWSIMFILLKSVRDLFGEVIIRKPDCREKKSEKEPNGIEF